MVLPTRRARGRGTELKNARSCLGVEMKIKLDIVITTLLVACAVVTTALVVRREFFAKPPAAARPDEKPVLVDNWRSHLTKGTLMGPADASVQLIEFADFECPFCASYAKDLKTILERYPQKVALTYVHYPLQNHRFAEPAARVVECAGQQGRFEAMYERLFEQQQSFGLKPWSEFATEAGVPDVAAFDTCVKSTEPVLQIEQGKQLGNELEVRGTPTLLVNGWKLTPAPRLEELNRMVKAVLAGRSPIAIDGKAAE
jgi:protein-disulfide isomerase